MLLTLDIGNTNVTLGLFRGEELGPRWRLATTFSWSPRAARRPPPPCPTCARDAWMR